MCQNVTKCKLFVWKAQNNLTAKLVFAYWWRAETNFSSLENSFVLVCVYKLAVRAPAERFRCAGPAGGAAAATSGTGTRARAHRNGRAKRAKPMCLCRFSSLMCTLFVIPKTGERSHARRCSTVQTRRRQQERAHTNRRRAQ